MSDDLVEFIDIDGYRWFADVKRPLPALYCLCGTVFERIERAHGKRRWFVYQEVQQ